MKRLNIELHCMERSLFPRGRIADEGFLRVGGKEEGPLSTF